MRDGRLVLSSSDSDITTDVSKVEFLFSQLSRRTLDGFMPVKASQLVEADRILWFRMVELTRSGVAVAIVGIQPLAVALQEARQDPQVSLMLAPAARMDRAQAISSSSVAPP
eukprot:765027-Amphidinium_carterae.1